MGTAVPRCVRKLAAGQCCLILFVEVIVWLRSLITHNEESLKYAFKSICQSDIKCMGECLNL